MSALACWLAATFTAGGLPLVAVIVHGVLGLVTLVLVILTVTSL